jgi:hypothetical protein
MKDGHSSKPTRFPLLAPTANNPAKWRHYKSTTKPPQKGPRTPEIEKWKTSTLQGYQKDLHVRAYFNE